MRELIIDVDTSALDEAFRNAPEQINKYLKAGVSTAGSYVSRAAREEAPKAETTLANSIRSNVVGELKRMISSHQHYNGIVVSETQPQGMPPVQSILDWIKVKRIQPHRPDMNQRDLAFVMARSITRSGTAGNDFYDRAAEQTQDKVTEILRRSVQHGLHSAGLGSV